MKKFQFQKHMSTFMSRQYIIKIWALLNLTRPSPYDPPKSAINYKVENWIVKIGCAHCSSVVGIDTLSTSASVVFMATLLADSLWIPEPNSFNPRIRGSEWPNQVDHYTIITVEYHLFHPSISLVQFIPFMMPKMCIKARTFCPKIKLL